MRPKALAEHIRDDLTANIPYALAIEPDDSQARSLEQMLDGRIGGTLRVVRSTDEAFASLVESIPDLILMSPLLAPQDEDQILARLAVLGAGAAHVKLLSIPRVVDDPPVEKKPRFGWQVPKSVPGVIGGRGASAFANEVAEYLAQASTLRQESPTVQGSRPVSEAAGESNAEADTLAGLRLEHIEQLLERLDAEPPVISVPERDLMAMTTTHDLPRFLNLDEQVPLPLRALLDEADGCLKMSFMTGAGACAGRTLELLFSEQGLGGGDRADQIQQLGKKHPAIAESFLRGLSLVTNNPSGAWDEARVTLAIAILKAIAYEIYVLGPERKERAAYVIELLERFKAAGRA